MNGELIYSLEEALTRLETTCLAITQVVGDADDEARETGMSSERVISILNILSCIGRDLYDGVKEANKVYEKMFEEYVEHKTATENGTGQK